MLKTQLCRSSAFASSRGLAPPHFQYQMPLRTDAKATIQAAAASRATHDKHWDHVPISSAKHLLLLSRACNSACAALFWGSKLSRSLFSAVKQLLEIVYEKSPPPPLPPPLETESSSARHVPPENRLLTSPLPPVRLQQIPAAAAASTANQRGILPFSTLVKRQH